MRWPSRKSTEPPAEDSAAPAAAAPSGGGFSAPPSSDAPPLASPVTDAYSNSDFSKYSSSIYEREGHRDAMLAQRESYGSYGGGSWIDNIQNKRARQCANNIQLGAKMGASVGGCFGLLTGAYMAVSTRNVLVLPVSVIGGAVSFGFFLGCGMVIRCEDQSPRGLKAIPDGARCQCALPAAVSVPQAARLSLTPTWADRAGRRTASRYVE